MEGPTYDTSCDVEIVFLHRTFSLAGEPLIQLIRPRSPLSATYAHTKESKLQIHHVCFTVQKMGASMRASRTAVMFHVVQVRSAPAIGGSAVCFFFARAIG